MLTLQFTPFPTLQTPRLLLRALELPLDVEAVFLKRSDPRLLRYIGRLPMLEPAEAEKWISDILDATVKNEGINWAIAFREAPAELIGTIGFWKIDTRHHRAEIGYSLAFEHWGRGIVTEALSQVLEYGWRSMNLHTVVANTDPENLASARVLEKQGFVQEAYFRESFYFDGKYGDSRIFCKINPYH